MSVLLFDKISFVPMDRVTKKQRSYIMSRIRGKNTSIEMMVRRKLWRQHLRGYRVHKKMLGNPDIVYNNKKVAIFLDGDFWHGWELTRKRRKLTPYWSKKIKRNMARDAKNSRDLKQNGWKVLRFWEHEVISDIDKVIKKISEVVS